MKDLSIQPSTLFEPTEYFIGPTAAILKCPVCGVDYTHVIGAFTRIGSDEFEAGGAYRGTEAAGVTGARRSALVVLFECENGQHRFALVIQQHKGQNFCTVERWPDEDLEVLWDAGRRDARERLQKNRQHCADRDVP